MLNQAWSTTQRPRHFFSTRLGSQKRARPGGTQKENSRRRGGNGEPRSVAHNRGTGGPLLSSQERPVIPQLNYFTMKGLLRIISAVALASFASAFVSPSVSRASLPRTASLIASTETSTANNSYSAPAEEIDRRRNLAIICETPVRGIVLDVACH